MEKSEPMTTEQLIITLNQPLADALNSLGLRYSVTGKSETDTERIFEFTGDGPKIEVRIEKILKWFCPDCGYRFDEPVVDNDGEYCPDCLNSNIKLTEESE